LVAAERSEAALGDSCHSLFLSLRLGHLEGRQESLTREFRTLGDDGVRVTADGQRIIDEWSWDRPTHNERTLILAQDKTVEILVEHFEIDGYAVLELGISPQAAARLK
jgi:hypothetical protein